MTDEEKAALVAWLKAPRPKGAAVGAPLCNLRGADLERANLTRAILTDATMPDGTKHP